MTTTTTTSLGFRAAFTRWLMLGIVASTSAALLTGCLGHLKHPFKHGHGHSEYGASYDPVSVPSQYAGLDATAPAADTTASTVDVTPSRDRLAGIPVADSGIRPAVLVERPADSSEVAESGKDLANGERNDATVVTNQSASTIPDVTSAEELSAIVRPEGAPAVRQFMENLHGEVSVGVSSRGNSGTVLWTGSSVEVAPNFTVGVGVGVAARN